jgi:Flp pilus assembly protein TadG
MYGLSLHIRQFLRRENATATMEFVITFPIIMILFIAVFETSMIMTRQVMMERTLDQAVRILRLANGLTVTPADIRTAICDNTSLLPDCDTLLTIDLREIDRATYDRARRPGDVHRTRGQPRPRSANTFNPGSDNQLMMVRACMIIDRLLPFSGFGLNLTRDDSGGLHMMAASVFVNEPD